MRIDPETWPSLSQLLDECLDLPPQYRGAWLESLGPEHAHLLPALRELILAGARPEHQDFLNTLPRIGPSESSAAHPAFTAGGIIGPYRLLRELGEGGMGVVWLAERADNDVRHPVALKLPLVSLHNRALVDRFIRERDILAQLAHSRIARLYDAGITDKGQPYLAIEYVEGEPITAHCDRQLLPVKARLKLFLQVLGAVQYAHTNLIVHRDLKPANILVTKDGEVRLLDFGIAKLLTGGEAHETELTRVGGRALTPAYASPEQVAGYPVTTASDVYSLGVILYELLTGERPYRLRRDTRLSVEAAILGSDPLRPSQTVQDAAKAQTRVTTPKKLARALRGDLDTIVLKALGRTPQGRYTTADAFAQDVERYLAGQPVLAQPESVWYRAEKFVKRNKLAVGLAAALALVVVAVGAGMGVSLYEARQAQRRFAQVRELANHFVFDFEASIRDTPGTLEARRMVAATGRQYLGTLIQDAAGDPLLTGELAEASYRLSQVEYSAGETGPSTEHLQKAVDLLHGQRGGCCQGTQQQFLMINALSDLASKLEDAGSYQRSLDASTEAIERARAWLRSSPQEPLAKRGLVTALLARGSVFRPMGRLGDARQADEEALRLAEESLAAEPGNDDAAFDRVQAGHSLAVIERELGETAAAWDLERTATQVLDGLLLRHADNTRWRQVRMRMQSTAATLLLKLAETDPAMRPQVLPAMRLAYQLAKEAVDRNPGDYKLVDLKTVMADRLARYLGGIGQPVEGLAIADQSRTDAEQLVRSNPAMRRNLMLQESVRQLQGWLLLQTNRLDEAERVLAEADSLAERVLKQWPGDMELLDDRSTTLSYRVAVAMRLGHLDAARERCRLGLGVTAEMLRNSGGAYPVESLARLHDQARQLGL